MKRGAARHYCWRAVRCYSPPATRSPRSLHRPRYRRSPMREPPTKCRRSVQNTAIGSRALLLNTTGSDNTATGMQALNVQHDRPPTTPPPGCRRSISTRPAKTTPPLAPLPSTRTRRVPKTLRMGLQVLYSNTTGNHNSAIGFQTLVIELNWQFQQRQWRVCSLWEHDRQLQCGQW